MTSEYRTTMAGGETEPMEEQPTLLEARINDRIQVLQDELNLGHHDERRHRVIQIKAEIKGLETALGYAGIKHCSWCGERDCQYRERPQGCWQSELDDGYPF